MRVTCLSLTHTHFLSPPLSLSLSLSHTHTHTHSEVFQLSHATSTQSSCEKKSKIYTADTTDCYDIKQGLQKTLVPIMAAWQKSYRDTSTLHANQNVKNYYMQYKKQLRSQVLIFYTYLLAHETQNRHFNLGFSWITNWNLLVAKHTEPWTYWSRVASVSAPYIAPYSQFVSDCTQSLLQQISATM
jgi:hypothetical protein